MKLTHLSVVDLLRAFRSPEPTPGGGSAAALAGAVGASLLAMVSTLAKPRTSTEEDAARLAAAGTRAAALSEELVALVDRDSEAYDGVVAAFRLPKSTDDEKAVRLTRIQGALRKATETPLDVMRACAAAIEQGPVVAAFGNPSASSDVLVGVELLGAAVNGGRLNVEVNVPSLKDAAFVERARAESAALVESARRGIEATRASVAEPNK